MRFSVIYLNSSRAQVLSGSVGLSDSSQPAYTREAMELLGHSTLSPYILFARPEQTNGTGVATSHFDFSFGDSSVAPSSRKHPSDMLGAAITKAVGLQLLLDQLKGMVTATNK